MTKLFPTEDPKLPLAPWEESSLDVDFDVPKTHEEEIFYLGSAADEQPPSLQPPGRGGEAGFPLAPWEESSLSADFDESKTHEEEVFYLEGETDEQPPSLQPPGREGEAGFPWQSSGSNQKTTSSKPLPWEIKDTSSEQSYQKQPSPQIPFSPPRPSTSKNLLQPKKFTSDIWQNIPLWGYVTAATVFVLGIGVVWTANSLPKASTGEGQQSAIAGKNSAAGTGASSSSIPVRPMRSRVAPGSASNDASKPGYMPEATPARPTASSFPNERLNSADSTSSTETSSESSSASASLPPASSAKAEAEGGPQNPFSPAYPAPKPAEQPKPTLALPPLKPLPLPPPPKVLPALLSLVGVATDGKTKLAIVRVGDQPLTAEAQVGAKIEGWTVTAISDETLTLRKGKQRQVLRLP